MSRNDSPYLQNFPEKSNFPCLHSILRQRTLEIIDKTKVP